MTLDGFEAAGHEVWQVTQSQWVDIMQRYTSSLGQTPNQQEYKEYHKDSVARALVDGKVVPDVVLQDYPELEVEVNKSQQAIDDFQRLVIGDPISAKINVFGTMSDGFFVGFIRGKEALVYVKVKGKSKPMIYHQVDIFKREGGKPTATQMKVISKWKDALDSGKLG